VLCQSARGLAHSKTLREFRERGADAPVFEVRQPSAAFPLSCSIRVFSGQNFLLLVVSLVGLSDFAKQLLSPMTSVSTRSAIQHFLRNGHGPATIGAMKSWFAAAACLILFVCLINGCGGPSHQIVGSWRLGDDPNAIVWEFGNDRSVVMGTNHGRYSFGDDNRIKIETPNATSVYQMEISGNKMTLKDPRGSKLEFTRIK
jgi:hypothetical protein